MKFILVETPLRGYFAKVWPRSKKKRIRNKWRDKYVFKRFKKGENKIMNIEYKEEPW